MEEVKDVRVFFDVLDDGSVRIVFVNEEGGVVTLQCTPGRGEALTTTRYLSRKMAMTMGGPQVVGTPELFLGVLSRHLGYHLVKSKV